MSLTDNYSWIQDRSSSAPLFNGSKVYFVSDTVQIAGNLLVRSDPKIMQNVGFSSTETATNTKYQQRQNRLKSEVGFNAFDETLFTLSGVLHVPNEELFNYPSNSFNLADAFAKYDFLIDREFSSDTSTTPTNNIVPALSVNRVWAIKNFPRTLYVYDPQLIYQLIRGATTVDANGVYTFYTTNGVPMIVRSVNLVNNREGATTFSLTFVEDKELV